ncbi:MAG: OmpA family protein [Chitinophagales bacterium]|nr:OmpA family protein [Chitinophagales bacterium]
MKPAIFFAFIFTFLSAVAQDMKPTDTEALLNVVVVNADNKPQEGEVITFLSLKDEKTFTGTTDAEGKFSILIPKAQKFKVQYKVFSTEQDFKPLEIPDVDELLTFTYTITVKPPKVYTLDNVFFDPGKSTLSSESFKELKELVEYMTKKKTMVIEIAGHTDNTGKAELNQKLSEERATIVRDYLLKKGIAAERVVAKGYGDTEPIADNNTPEGRQKNRRTEVRIITE